MDKKNFISAVSIIAGTCIGAGFLGIPYVASKAGFLTALFYLIIFAGIILLVNLYLGEVILRTKSIHQLSGYCGKYLGKKGKKIMIFATRFTIYSVMIAYMVGVGESISFLIFNEIKYAVLIGTLFGLSMSPIIFKGIKELKKVEKAGLISSIIILFLIFLVFSNKINLANLQTFNSKFIFLPFGIVLFSLMSFFSLPEAKIALGKDRKNFKKAIIIGTLLPAFFYALFTFVVVGFKGESTPEIATLALGGIFIFLGIVTMITSYISLGNALMQNYSLDLNYKKQKAWFFSSILPVGTFILTQLFSFFSFTRILSLGGVISGGLIGILVLLMVKKSEKLGDLKPEYKIPINNAIIIILSLIFIIGLISEIFI